MADCLSGVHDIVHPSPIALKELSAIAVAIQLWRLDLNQHRLRNIVEDFCRDVDSNSGFTLKNVIPIPNVPPVIEPIVNKYAEMLPSSTLHWLRYNYNHIFKFHRNTCSSILNDFDDIVCDYDGVIHYVRTAERMLRCDRISLHEKFEIACAYCFEDSIRQMWQSIGGNIDVNDIDLHQRPFVYYWVCYLRNDLHKVHYSSVNELMLSKCSSENRSSFEYFWNRTSSGGRYRNAVSSSESEICLILPKLNEQQFIKLATEKGGKWVYQVWCNAKTKDQALPLWTYTKDLMNEKNFTKMINEMLRMEANAYCAVAHENDEYSQMIRELAICCKIWNSARTDLKRSAIEHILPADVVLFKQRKLDPSTPRATLLLQTVLRDATLEEKTLFWNRNWFSFLVSTRSSDFDRLMKLCLEDENEIERFKANVNSSINYGDLSHTLCAYLQNGHAKELIHVLNFCSPDVESRIDFKRRVLRENFLGQRSILTISNRILCHPESLWKLINDAYNDDVGLVTDFCNQLISSQRTVNELLLCVHYVNDGHFSRVKQFIEFFPFTVQNIDRIKGLFIDKLKEYLREGEVWKIDIQALRAVVLWSMGSDERVIEFKQTISPEQVVRKMVENEISSDEDDDVASTSTKPIRYPDDLDKFLSWYFDTPEKINEFKVEMSDVFNGLSSPNRR